VIGVSDEDADKLDTFIKANNVDYAIATDTKAKMKKFLNVSGHPRTCSSSAATASSAGRASLWPRKDPAHRGNSQADHRDRQGPARAKKEASKETKPAKPEAAKPDAKDGKPADETNPTKK